jgi:hypothetical protein
MPKTTLALGEDLHKRIKIKCVEQDTSLQAVVVELLTKWVEDDFASPEKEPCITHPQGQVVPPVKLKSPEQDTPSWMGVPLPEKRYAADTMTQEELGYGKPSPRRVTDWLNTLPE